MSKKQKESSSSSLVLIVILIVVVAAYALFTKSGRYEQKKMPAQDYYVIENEEGLNKASMDLESVDTNQMDSELEMIDDDKSKL